MANGVVARAESDAIDASLACARQVLDAVPLLMREIRSEMRRSAPSALSVPSFRALIFAHVNPGGSLTELATHLGVTLPTASVAVDKLTARGLMLTPREGNGQRRRTLYLSAQGERVVRRAMDHTVRALGERLRALPVGQLESLQLSLAALSEVAGKGALQRHNGHGART
ncbi:MAG TPA: MarR family winged helix-turn-helix transcriptional regulator [Burkholderiaceae bacterium]|nr:MarR family winged helix-turn-helix transcriptional regulator [Burkholderiaceae bacterium]